MNNMKINRLKIVNYKLFQNVTIEMNENINIFVGENDSGKSTILEALSMVLTGKINGSSVANRLNLDWFNAQVRQKFKKSIEAGNTSDLPTIEIEVCTRAKHSVVFAMENPCENGVFKATDIHFSDKSIPAYKFSKPDSDI